MVDASKSVEATIGRANSGLGGFDIWHAMWTDNGFATPTIVEDLNSQSDDYLPTLSADRLMVYFTSVRVAPGTKGGFDVWMLHRSTVNDRFSTPTLVDELNTAGDDYALWLSVDNCRMYGMSNSGGANRFFMAARQP